MSVAVEKINVTDRESWLVLRQSDLTASDVPGWLGADPRATPMRVMARKRGIIDTDNDNQMLKGGRWLEAAAIEALREENPDWDVRKASVYLRAPAHRNGATPDAVAIDPTRSGFGNIQIKTVALSEFKRHWMDGNRIVAPIGYQVQSIDEAMLLGAEWNSVAAFVVGEYTREIHLVDVPRHDKLEAKILKSAEQFWDMHDAGLWPAADYARDRDVLEARFRDWEVGANFKLRDDPEVTALLNEHFALKQTIAGAKSRKDAIEARIIELMGASPFAPLRHGRILYKEETRDERWQPEWRGRVLRINWTPPENEENENE